MTEKGPESRQNAQPAGNLQGKIHCRIALGHVEQQGQGSHCLIAGTQYIGRADIAGSGLAQVATTRQAGQEQPERNRAQQIAEQ